MKKSYVNMELCKLAIDNLIETHFGSVDTKPTTEADDYMKPEIDRVDFCYVDLAALGDAEKNPSFTELVRGIGHFDDQMPSNHHIVVHLADGRAWFGVEIAGVEDVP